MPLNIPFESIEETSMRLEQTIVRYDGEPVFVTRVSPHDDNNPRIHIKALPLATSGEIYDEDQPRRAPVPRNPASFDPAALVAADTTVPGSIRKVINSPKLDMEPFALGLCNTSLGVMSVSRLPTRKYKQGLSSNNVSISNVDRNQRNHGFSGILTERGFADMLMGIYPNAAELSKMFKDSPNLASVAISPDFYVKRHPLGMFFLCSLEEEIGWVGNVASEAFKVAKKYGYYKEVFESKVKITVEFMES